MDTAEAIKATRVAWLRERAPHGPLTHEECARVARSIEDEAEAIRREGEAEANRLRHKVKLRELEGRLMELLLKHVQAANTREVDARVARHYLEERVRQLESELAEVREVIAKGIEMGCLPYKLQPRKLSLVTAEPESTAPSSSKDEGAECP